MSRSSNSASQMILGVVLLGLTAPARSQQAPPPASTAASCTTGCHTELKLPDDPKHKGMSCVRCHPNVTDGQADHTSAMTDQDGQATCGLGGCHEDQVKKLTAGFHKDLSCESCHGYLHDEYKVKDLSGCRSCHKEQVAQLAESVHTKNTSGKTADCTDCHGDLHEVRKHTDAYSPMSKVLQVTTCGECHDKPIVRAYRKSVHGQGLLRSGLAVAPSCASCHGAHDIAAVRDPASKLSHDNVTTTCGTCHEFIVTRWKTSAHGKAFADHLVARAKGEPEGAEVGQPGAVPAVPEGQEAKPGNGKLPVCTTCHSGHETLDPRVFGNHLKMADRCGECHQSQAATYRESFHGKATKLGLEVAATCADCHTPHEMLPASDAKSSVNPKNLTRTCGECHKDINDSFVEFEPHLDPTDSTQNRGVHLVWLFMTTLLLGTLGFFTIHTLLWLQRAVVAARRGEFPKHAEGTIWIRRFRPVHMMIHVAIVVTFLLLAATGLPIKFGAENWAHSLEQVIGGVRISRLLHRAAGVLTFAYAITFVGYLAREIIVRKRRELLFGWQSMVPRWRDLTDLAGNVKWFLYMGDRPKFDRWTYWEKFDFFAVFWGVPIIGFSGLVLWFPVAATKFVPGVLLNVAYIIHSDEALLATGFIFFFHFFHTHLRPEAFPMDPVMFLGRMPLERFKEERPAEYERLVEAGQLETLYAPPPTEREVRRAYRFGWTAFSVGILLGIFLIISGVGAVLR